MKDIKRLLRQDKDRVLPDERVKDNIKRGLGYDGGEDIDAGGGALAKKSRNVWIAICAAAAAIIIALAIILPSLTHDTPLPGGGIIDGNKFEQITDSDSFYAYGAVSVGSVLASRAEGAAAVHSSSVAAFSYNGGSAFCANAARPAGSGSVAAASVARSWGGYAAEGREGGSSDSQLSGEQLEAVNRYMSIVESLLSDGDIEGEAIAGDCGYDYGMTVSYTDLLGGSVSYVMYYDKIFRGGESDGDEREEYYSIEGVLIIGGESYPVEGNYTSESEEDEEESSLYFRAYTSQDRRSYIEVSRESENESEGGQSESEYEYIYTVYEDGRAAERMRVEYEQEEGELELLMTIERDGLRETLIFEDETEDGERVIAVRGDIDGQNASFRIYVRDGQYHYVFGDGSYSDYDRYDDDDDDDDDGDHDDDDDDDD